jgi:hypothetical protein
MNVPILVRSSITSEVLKAVHCQKYGVGDDAKKFPSLGRAILNILQDPPPHGFVDGKNPYDPMPIMKEYEAIYDGMEKSL